jgi:hypothetical protein
MEEEIEYWKDIEEYEGLYQVSSYGRIKSFHLDKINGRIMKPTKDKNNYIITRLSESMEEKTEIKVDIYSIKI